jgi:hypothetical protein
VTVTPSYREAFAFGEPTMKNEEIWDLLKRAMLLDDSAFDEIRYEDSLTAVAVLAAVGAIFLAGVGAWLFGITVLDSTPDGWLLDTLFLGTFFTFVLFAGGSAITYLLMTRVFHVEDVQIEEFARVALLAYAPYGLSFFVFVPEFGFVFGILSIIAVFFYSVYGIGVAFSQESQAGITASVLAGLIFWLLLITLISGPGSNYATGVFVFSLID